MPYCLRNMVDYSEGTTFILMNFLIVRGFTLCKLKMLFKHLNLDFNIYFCKFILVTTLRVKRQTLNAYMVFRIVLNSELPGTSHWN